MRTILLSVLAALVVASGVFGAGFVVGRDVILEEYHRLVAQVNHANENAEAVFNELVAAMDKKQATIDRLAQERERLDEQTSTEINRLADELDRRNVRVRVVTEPGVCSGGADSDTAGSAGDGSESAGATSWLLPEKNTERLREALIEVEKLSAAYNSCRSHLLIQRAVTP